MNSETVNMASSPSPRQSDYKPRTYLAVIDQHNGIIAKCVNVTDYDALAVECAEAHAAAIENSNRLGAALSEAARLRERLEARRGRRFNVGKVLEAASAWARAFAGQTPADNVAGRLLLAVRTLEEREPVVDFDYLAAEAPRRLDAARPLFERLHAVGHPVSFDFAQELTEIAVAAARQCEA